MNDRGADGLIRVEDFTFRYPGADDLVLDGANLKVGSGDFLVLLGGNGSGKTTLCKCFNGLIPHFFEGETSGRVIVDGTDTATASVGELARTVGYVYQDFENQLVQPTVRRDVEFGPLNYGWADYGDRAQQALERLGVEHLADQFIWELSGGEKHLAAIAGVLALDPDALVVDEPAAQLDPANARRVYETLASLNESGQTIVTIEHDTELVAGYADRVALIEAGRVRWVKPTAEALNCREELQEHDIHPPRVTELCHRLGATIDDHGTPRFPISVEEAMKTLPRPNGSPSGTSPASGPSAPAGDAPVITLEDVRHGYLSMQGEEHSILDGFSMEVHAGENVALIGDNGAGKTTILKLVTGIERPDAGRVDVLGTDTAEASPETLAEKIVYVHQQPEEMFVEDSIENDVSYYLRQRNRDETGERVDEVLSYLGLESLREADGRLLSIGQQRRASLAIALAMEPSVLLLDEPTGCLDVESRREVATMFDRVHDRVKAVVVATHDLTFTASWANRVIVLDDGDIVVDAPPAQAFTDPAVLQSEAFRPPQPVEVSRRLGLDPAATTVDELAERLRDVS